MSDKDKKELFDHAEVWVQIFKDIAKDLPSGDDRKTFNRAVKETEASLDRASNKNKNKK